jgi:DNA (cytosine-5)-methyltransferase 1
MKMTMEEAVYRERMSGALLRKRKKPRLIDLFSGAGGLTLGFTKRMLHCFIPVWANDINHYAVESYNRNFGPHCVEGDLIDLLNSPNTIIPEADVVIGGPPCQGFSLLNRNREADPRKQLWRPFLDVVKISGARIFVMENVPQLLSSHEFMLIEKFSNEMGFEIAAKVLCAADYGVPQRRFRAFIVGCNFTSPRMFFPPRKTHYDPDNGYQPNIAREFSDYVESPCRWANVKDAIADLEPPIGSEIREEPPPYNLHFGRNPTPKSLDRYRAIPEEGMNRFDLQKKAPRITPACWIRKKTGGTDLFGRLWWKRQAFTIRTEFFKPEKGRYLHPEQHRPITHREAARFQSFPDDFAFSGTKVEIAKQIGNAVPPLLAARVADCVYALWTAKR